MFFIDALGFLLLFIFMIGAGIWTLVFVILLIRDIIDYFKKKKNPTNPYGW